MPLLKDLLPKILEWLLKASGPAVLAALIALEDHLTKLLDTIPSLWLFRILALLLSISLLLAALLFLSRPKFVEHKGSLFKRNEGGYHEAVYCPKCKTPTATGSYHTASHFKCQCGWVSEITKGNLLHVIKKLS